MKLFIISNRLPVTFIEENGKYIINKSSGGLVSGISSYLASMNSSSLDKSKYYWVGWPGLSFPEKKQSEIRETLLDRKLVPVFLNEKTMDKFYFGFCNKTVWPLFHYFPAYTVYDNDMWDNYKFVNEKFCDIICDMVKPNDTIWIHDYHLMLLPSLIRKRISNARIGFFLHIPFPHFEIFRLLPAAWREEILKGMLGADLIGFHTNDYSRYFLGSVLRLLGYDNQMGEIQLDDRIVKVETFQMGIDYANYENLALSDKTNIECNSFKQSFKNQKIILSIDRLDYTKGILNRLRGYQLFLEKNPEWHGKVTMLAVTVPSRIGVEKYYQMKKEIDEIIGKINGIYSTLDWTPIVYQYRSFQEEQLSALYKISDVALITPLRDGMNLISKEYMASRTDNTGVLVLSEMAGASKEMIEAITINPNHIENISDSIKIALEMKKTEQIRRNTAIRKRLKSNDVIKWANNFLLSVYHIKGKQLTFEKKYLDEDIKQNLISDYNKAKRKIIFLDYDGTLVPFRDDPEKAEPDKELLDLLTELAKDSSIHLVIISGRDFKTLDKWFWSIKCSLVAEHGVWIKKRFKKWKIARKLDDKWKWHIIPFLEAYSEMLAGSFYEEKSHSLVWHYRKSDKIYGEMAANELTDSLKNVTARMNLHVLKGHDIVEIRNIDIDKGTGVKDFNPESNYDFIMAIGDDWTDEDMFKALPHTAYTIKVGMAKSYSKFNVYNYNEARNLLKDLLNAK
jgi:trehalose 6-phosphate synthase/phosphatase